MERQMPGQPNDFLTSESPHRLFPLSLPSANLQEGSGVTFSELGA